jgi:hypothetical protein
VSLEFRVNNLFFDTAKVIRSLDAASRKALSKAGAFIRTRAKSSIRKRKSVAPAGKPPSSHTGDLKRLIFFGYDTTAKSVVIGPAKFRTGEAPNLLEFGGQIVRRGRGGKPTTQHYKGNAFMGPALNAEVAAGTIPEQWRNSVRE